MQQLTIEVGCKQIFDNFDFPANMSTLGVEVTLYHSGCHGDHMTCIIILGLSVIYHPINVVPFGVHCCVHNSRLFHFIIVPLLIEDSATVLIGCKHGFLALGFQSSLYNYMINVYFNTKLKLNLIKEISVIVSWSQLIRKSPLVTIRAQWGLVLGPYFAKMKGFWPLRLLRQNNKKVPR